MEPIIIDNWTITFTVEGNWVAFILDDIDEPDGSGYNVWIQGDSVYVESFGLQDEPNIFAEIPLKIIKKLLELK